LVGAGVTLNGLGFDRFGTQSRVARKWRGFRRTAVGDARQQRVTLHLTNRRLIEPGNAGSGRIKLCTELLNGRIAPFGGVRQRQTRRKPATQSYEATARESAPRQSGRRLTLTGGRIPMRNLILAVSGLALGVTACSTSTSAPPLGAPPVGRAIAARRGDATRRKRHSALRPHHKLA